MKITSEIRPSPSRAKCWTYAVCIDGVKMFTGEVYGDRAKAAEAVARIVADLESASPADPDPHTAAAL